MRRIEPANRLSVAGQTVAAQPTIARGNEEIWPLAVLLTLVLVCAEWLVYNLKVRL